MSLRKLFPLPLGVLLALPLSGAGAQRASIDDSRNRFKVPAAFSGSLGLLNVKGEGTGLSVVGSLVIGSQYIALTLSPLDLGIYKQKGDQRYNLETESNGNEVCRDSETGRFASKSLCNGSARYVYSASAELAGALPIGGERLLAIGGGYRTSSGDGPYGLVALHFRPMNQGRWFLRGRFGQKLVDVGVGGSYQLP